MTRRFRTGLVRKHLRRRDPNPDATDSSRREAFEQAFAEHPCPEVRTMSRPRLLPYIAVACAIAFAAAAPSASAQRAPTRRGPMGQAPARQAPAQRAPAQRAPAAARQPAAQKAAAQEKADDTAAAPDTA